MYTISANAHRGIDFHCWNGVVARALSLLNLARVLHLINAGGQCIMAIGRLCKRTAANLRRTRRLQPGLEHHVLSASGQCRAFAPDEAIGDRPGARISVSARPWKLN